MLSWHLDRGTRPDGSPDNEGVRWTVKEFAAAVGANERSVRAWRRGKYPPMDLLRIERALFGNNPAYANLLDELRRLNRLTRGGDQSTEAPFSRTAPEFESRDLFELFASEFKQAVAFFQIGPGRVVLFTDPEKALVAFREVINRVWAVDRTDSRERMLVWLLDLGS